MQAQVGTIRLRLFKITARVVVSARRVVFHLASSYPCHELLCTLHERLWQRRRSPATETG